MTAKAAKDASIACTRLEALSSALGCCVSLSGVTATCVPCGVRPSRKGVGPVGPARLPAANAQAVTIYDLIHIKHERLLCIWRE